MEGWLTLGDALASTQGIRTDRTTVVLLVCPGRRSECILIGRRSHKVQSSQAVVEERITIQMVFMCHAIEQRRMAGIRPRGRRAGGVCITYVQGT